MEVFVTTRIMLRMVQAAVWQIRMYSGLLPARACAPLDASISVFLRLSRSKLTAQCTL
jgi:hypothetical protein